MNDEILRLQAEALEAEAQAAAAKAAAAKARLEAALAAQESGSPEPQPNEDTSPEPAPAAAPAKSAVPATEQHAEPAASPAPDPAPVPSPAASDYEQTVRAGYTFDGPTLTVGTYMEDGVPRPATQVRLPLGMLNRHGLIAGATGTGKTRTLQLFAEGLSASGVPCFVTDIKGDLTGLLEPGPASDKLAARAAEQGQDWAASSFPTELYALGGEGNGTPIRTTISDFGPILLAKVLGLNETQESALSLIFHWADTNQLALIDITDLRAVFSYLTSDSGKDELKAIGGVAPATAGVILRNVAELEAQGGALFFGEPAFSVAEFIRTDDGRGVISALELPDIQSRPALFSTFLMWLLAELFQELPEVGDPDKPKLVFFFDEAHLLFDGASKEFLRQVVQTVRLIRSKGVGIVFITQTPTDIPADVLAQLGSKVQHALRAHTPAEAKKLRETVATFPTSPLDLEQILPSLGTGEAIVTILDKKGRPSPVAPVRIWAPAAVMGPASAQAIDAALRNSPTLARYKDPIDPESAFELLEQRMAAEAAAREEAQRLAEAAKEAAKLEAERKKELDRQARELEKQIERERREAEKEAERRRRAAEAEAERQRKRREATVDQMVRTAGRTLTREITRAIFGTRRR
ncbi:MULTISPECIES: helicase HerA-like domain-containing protein [Trueperella]|uniref:helicase HerA-like domain-containing protein n=1 Tax=Trueperella TaxID=1069494 RepID=UPI000837D9B9|nr:MULTISPECIES: helicase HerA-like domain-containing protein [Trueperella]MDV6238451.1 helicase HerA-like domain-containing protein [Trueperella bernardiae]OCW60113.1 ATPase [Trueperella bernardiae]OFS65372.1 ATPase [Trueperella sp. HMSC08H06]WIM07172.1 DUF853 family protein [Trueperella bernardiae]